MPLDSATAPAEPVKVDRSSGLGAALSGMVEKELPGALAESKAIDVEKKGFADEAVGRLEAGSAKRATLQAPVPPPPSQAPQPQFRSQGEAWGSLAMVMASIGSAFTRRPFLNSLNAAADVMKAFRAGDLEAYKLNFDRWKAESEYGLKMYEYQRDAYKDAIASIDTDQKDALAKLRVLSAALKDDPLHRLTEVGNIAGIIALEQSRGTAQEKARGEIDKTRREGEISQELLASGKELRAQPNDPAAQQRYAAAQQAAKDFHLATHGGRTGDVRQEHADALYENLKRDWQAKNPDKTFSADDEARLRRQAAQSISGRAETNRLQPQMQRLLGAASQMEKHLENLSELPIDATVGPFMGVESKTPEALGEALKRMAARHVGVGEAAREMQVEFIGVSRQIATLDAQGVGTGLVGLSQQAEGYKPLPGDSPMMVMRKYASLRQIVDQAMESIKTAGTANADQLKGAEQIKASVARSIPWTVHDLNMLESGKDAKRRDKAAGEIARKILGASAAPRPEAAPGSTPAGGELAHEKAAIKAGAPRDAVRKRYIEGGGDAATFDREVK